MPQNPYDPTKAPDYLNREQAFMLYAAFSGDVAKSAHALDLSFPQMQRMVDDEGWAEKLKPILDLKKSTKPGDFERGMNRAVNFVQAHRLRITLERALVVLSELDEKGLASKLLEGIPSKDGQTLVLKTNSRSFADLASAIEKCQSLTYMALADTGTERGKRKETSDDAMSLGDIHCQIAEGMARIGTSKTPRAVLFDADLALANSKRIPESLIRPIPENPADNDDH